MIRIDIHDRPDGWYASKKWIIGRYVRSFDVGPRKTEKEALSDLKKLIFIVDGKF